MERAPDDWPRVTSCLYYDDAAKAIDWLCSAFGFEVRLKVEGEGGRIEHSELEIGEGLIMIGNSGNKPNRSRQLPCKSPRSLDGANTQSLCIYVDDVDAHCERARSAGAEIIEEPRTDDYGEEWGSHRSYGALDPESHVWWFMHRLRDPARDAH